MPKRDDCLCEPGTPCGYREVTTDRVRTMRAFGAIVRNGLDNKLSGWWVRECQFRAFEAAQALGAAAPKEGAAGRLLIKIHRKAEGYVVMQYRLDFGRETPEKRLAVRKKFNEAKAFVEKNFNDLDRLSEPGHDEDPSVVATWL